MVQVLTTFSRKGILVTGASGFVGGALLARLLREGDVHLRGVVRRAETGLPEGVEPVLVGGLAAGTDWGDALKNVQAVVHAAARVHVMRDASADALVEYRRVNVAGTLKLASQAVEKGVRRFVFISSIKVNGEETPPGRPYTADDVPAPLDPYGVSKHEAERALLQLADDTGLEVVIIRPVLVYGPGVRANFLAMMRWLHRGIPLPLGATHNKRSLVALDNLVDLVVTCLHHLAAARQIFLVSDGEDLSTTALLRRTARALQKTARLLPVPPSMLRAAGRLLGQREVVQRLCGSLQVDITKTRDLLGWTPPVSVDDALAQTAQHFLASLPG